MGAKALSITGLVAVLLIGAFLWVDAAPEPQSGGASVAAAQPPEKPPGKGAESVAEVRAVPRRSLASAEPVQVAAVEPAETPAEAQPGLCLVTGRLVSRWSAELADPWLCFWMSLSESADTNRGVPRAEVGADGRFKLKLERGLSGDVIYMAARHRVGKMPIVVPETGALDLGDLSLDLGATITGTAWHGGERVLEGTPVLAQAAFEETPLALVSQRLQKRGKGYMRTSAVSFADADGGFEFEGLEPGAHYFLEALAVPNSGPALATMLASSAGRDTVAPASGVRLNSGLARITLQVRLDGLPVEKAQVMQQLGPEDPRRVLGAAADNVGRPYFTGEAGELDLQVATGHALFVEVRAQGCQVQEVALGPDQVVPGAEVAIDLVRDVATADLVVELAGPPPSAIEGYQALLFVHGSDFKRYRVGPVSVQGGRARFEGLACDLRSGTFFLSPHRDAKLADLPFERFAGSQIKLGGLVPGEQREVRLESQSGGRVQLELAGLEEGKFPTFELIEASGNPVRPVIYAEKADGGHTFAMQLDGPGPYTLGQSLTPGTYTLRQTSEGYAPGDREIQLREGEATPILFQLEVR